MGRVMTRRLAAILVADVVGYSLLMRTDEERTVERFEHCCRDLVTPLVCRHGGFLLDISGDRILCLFDSVLEATRCAVRIHRKLAREEEARPVPQRLRFRMGLNIDDVLLEGGRAHGNGVNLAVRLEALAEPEGICLTECVYRQLQGRVAFPIRALGRRRIKNLPEPLRVWSLSADGSGGRPSFRPTTVPRDTVERLPCALPPQHLSIRPRVA